MKGRMVALKTLALMLKVGVPLPPTSPCGVGQQLADLSPPLQPLMADLPRLVGPACFCLLSGSVPLQLNLATG